MARELVIAGRRIADDTPPVVVAEIGHSHNGSVALAEHMVTMAFLAGADAVKFQSRNCRDIYTDELYNRPFVSEHAAAPAYGAHRQKEELGYGLDSAVSHALDLGMVAFSTPFDIHSADYLEGLGDDFGDWQGPPCYKIASGDLTNTPLLTHVARFGKPMLVSTGDATLDDVRRAYETIMPINPQLCLMQCTASYPAPAEELNLRVIETYRREFPECVVGWSSHIHDTGLAVAAYMLGARVIEYHFTLCHDARGTDHEFSLNVDEFAQMTRSLRRLCVGLGDGEKRPMPSEEKGRAVRRKSLYAAKDLPAGHVLTEADIAIKSPYSEAWPVTFASNDMDRLVGRTLVWGARKDDLLSGLDLERKAE